MGAIKDSAGSTPAAGETAGVTGRRLWDEPDADAAMTVRGVGSTVVLLSMLAGALALYWLELPSLENPVPSLLSLFIVMLAAVVVTRPEPFRLTTASTAIVTVAAVAAVALGTIAPPAENVLAYETRHVAISTVLLTTVILRGRIVWAWFGRVGVMAAVIFSTVVAREPLVTRLASFVVSTAILLAATVLVIWLTRSRRLSTSRDET
jgi:hypothetical protein